MSSFKSFKTLLNSMNVNAQGNAIRQENVAADKKANSSPQAIQKRKVVCLAQKKKAGLLAQKKAHNHLSSLKTLINH